MLVVFSLGVMVGAVVTIVMWWLSEWRHARPFGEHWPFDEERGRG